MNTRRAIACTVLACLISLVPALAADKWLHVRVDEDGEKVSVNVPLSLVETILPLIEADEFHRGKVRLEVGELEGLDLRELARALQETPDMDFVTVEGDDETVRVSKEGEFLIVVAEDRGGRGTETVRVRMPLAVVEALIGGDSDELDLVAALRVLGEYEGDALVDVVSDDSTIRVWIDESDSGS